MVLRAELMTWMKRGPPASADYSDDRRHERGPAGLSSFEGRVDAASGCGQLYHLRISAALHSLVHIQKTEGALISMRAAYSAFGNLILHLISPLKP